MKKPLLSAIVLLLALIMVLLFWPARPDAPSPVETPQPVETPLPMESPPPAMEGEPIEPAAPPPPPPAESDPPQAPPATVPPEADTIRFHGLVRDLEGMPVPGAVLHLQARGATHSSVEADAEGHFSLGAPEDAVREESALLLCRAEGYAEGRKLLQLHAVDALDEAYEADFELEPAAALEGRVLNPEGDPLSGITVVAEDTLRASYLDTPLQWLLPRYETQTDEDGHFSLEQLPEGEYRLEIRAASEGYVLPRERRQELRVRAGERRTVPSLVPIPAASVAGQVTAADGTPLAGVHLRLGPGDPLEAALSAGGTPSGQPHAVVSDDAGQFHMEGLEPRRSYRLTARLEGYADTVSAPFRPEAKDTPHRLDLQLSRGSTVSGHVFLEEDRPAAGRALMLFPDPDQALAGVIPPTPRETETDSAGAFVFHGVPAGSYALLPAGAPPEMPGAVTVSLDGESHVEGLELLFGTESAPAAEQR